MLPCVVWSFMGMVHQYLEEKGGDSEAVGAWGHSTWELMLSPRKEMPQRHPLGGGDSSPLPRPALTCSNWV